MLFPSDEQPSLRNDFLFGRECQFSSGLSLDRIGSVMQLSNGGMFAPLSRSPRAAQSCRSGRVFVQPLLEAQLRPLVCRDPLSMCAARRRAALRGVCVLCASRWTRAGAGRECGFGLASVALCRSRGPTQCCALSRSRVGERERRARQALDATGAVSLLTLHVVVSGPVAWATDKQIRLRWSAAHRECCSVRSCLPRWGLYISQNGQK